MHRAPTRIVALLVLATLAGLTSRGALAFPSFSDWPSRGVTIIVPFPSGTPNDIAARLYAEGLSRRWSRPVTVQNKPGTDGEAVVVRAAFATPNDDHTLVYTTASMIIVGTLLKRPDRPAPDFVAIASGASAFVVLVVADHVPAHSLKELVEHARSKPGTLTWGAGASLSHLAFATTVRRHRLEIRHVRYQRAPTDEPRVDVACNALQALAGPIGRGEVRVLAITSPQREPMLADVPTVAEAGFPEMEIEELAGLFGSRLVPPEVRDRIAADMRAVAGDAAFRDRLGSTGQRAHTGTPADFAAAIGRQRIRLQQLIHIVDPKSVQ